MPRGVIRQDQDRRLTTLHEVARHREHEVRVVAKHSVQESGGHFSRDLGTALHQWCGPPGRLTLVKGVRQLRSEPDRLRWYCGNDAIWRSFYEVPDEGTRNAEAKHHELVDPEVVHQTEVVI